MGWSGSAASAQLCGEVLAHAGAEGIELAEIIGYLNELQSERRT